ncbi:MAG: Riboflavin transporter [Chlamydiae bacterium]|nr:Riboflavin transporter [Chlamydiota bacterium]
MDIETSHKPIRPPPNRIKAVVYVLISWIFFTSVIALSRTATARTSVPTVLFFQNLVSMIIILPWMIKNGGRSLYLSKIGVIVLRALAGYICYAFIFLAVQRIPLVNIVLLSNSAPLFIPIVIWLWKRVKIRAGLWVGISIGFVGIAVILRPGAHLINVGALFGVGAAICMAISMIAQRRLVKSEPLYTILFYYFLISTILSIPFIIEKWTPLDASTLFILLTIGVLFVIGQLFFITAFKYEKPSFLGSFNYSAVVYGALIEWLFWDHFPSLLTIVGILIVCTGGIITILQGNGRGFTSMPKGPEPKPPEKDQSSNQ